MKRQNRITALLAGLLLCLPAIYSQELTPALRRANATNTITVASILSSPSILQSVIEMSIGQPIALESLLINAGNTAPGITAEEADMLYADGGFGGDAQKTIPATEGLFMLILCTLGYALVMRRKWRNE
jgi:hypothetical protein